MIPQLTPADVVRWRGDDARQSPLLVDVREPWEFAYCRIDGSVSIPLGEVLRRQAELPKDRPLVMVCHHGRRSQHAAMLLAGAGFPAVFNLEGGVEAWGIGRRSGDATVLTIRGSAAPFGCKRAVVAHRNGNPDMKRRLLAFAAPVALGLAAFAGPVAGEDLMQIYRDALVSDPTLGAARANYTATQELLPQARAGLLPVLSLLGNANKQDFRENLHSDPAVAFDQKFPQYYYTLSASQPLFRMQNWISFDQAKQQVGQGEFVLASAQQDLIVRVSQAYFDVLLAQFTIELTESQKAAVSENLAQAKRNFEVGVATITDTNDAQAKYDQIVSQEISVQNDLANRIAALRAIIGRTPADLKRMERTYQPELPVPSAIDPWVDKAIRENYQVRNAQANFDIATLEVERQRAGHYPTIDLVASFNQTYAGGAASTNLVANFSSDTRFGQIGVQLNVPLYQGGLVNSRTRQAVANLEAARQNLEAARRTAQLLAQTSFSGVTNGVAQVKALGQALKSAQVSYDSNKLGLEVGVRTNLDVLNQQQQVFQTRFNLAQAYYNFIINALKLKQSVGTLSDEDVERINRELGG